MEKILLFIETFLIIYLLYFFIVILRKKGLEKFKKGAEYIYLTRKYKFVPKNIKTFANIISVANAFIIATAMVVIDFVNNYILKLLVGFVIVFPLIICIYHIIGKSYSKKEN